MLNRLLNAEYLITFTTAASPPFGEQTEYALDIQTQIDILSDNHKWQFASR